MRKPPFKFRLWIDRVITGNPWQQIAVASVVFLIVLCVIGAIYSFKPDSNVGNSFARAFVDMISPVTVRNTAYDTVQYIPQEIVMKSDVGHDTLQHIPQMIIEKREVEGRRIWGLSIVYFLGAIFFSGLFIATITNMLRTESDRFKQGTIKYHFSKHIVFIGYDDMIVGMIQRICEERDGAAYIVVGVEENASKINDKIKSRLYGKYKKNIVVLQADGCNRKELDRMRVSYAESVYIIGEHDDAYNLKSYRTIYELSLCQKEFEKRMPQCYVNLRHKSTLTLFQTYATAGDIGVDFSAFRAFNFNDEWAKYMIVGEGLAEKNRIDRGKNPGAKQVHFVIVGMSEMGRALARYAMLWCHYPDCSTKISFIDPQADLNSKQFIGSHQQLFERLNYTYFDNFAKQISEHKVSNPYDIEFEFYATDISNLSIREQLQQWGQDEQQLMTIAICLPKASQSFAAGIYLPDEIFSKEGGSPVWIYQPTYGDLGNYLKGSHYANIVTFGMSGEPLDLCDKKNLERAKLINHYLKNRFEGIVTFDNQQLIDTEWEAIDINEKWRCINRASRVKAMKKMLEKKDICNFEEEDFIRLANIEFNRLKIERLIVPGVSLTEPRIEDEIESVKTIIKL